MASLSTHLLRGVGFVGAASLLASLLHAQIPIQSVTTSASATPSPGSNEHRLGAIKMTDSKVIAANSTKPSDTRRGGLLLAQIPPQPGTNPNTIRPALPPGLNRNPRAIQPGNNGAQPAGSAAPVTRPVPATQPSTSPVTPGMANPAQPLAAQPNFQPQNQNPQPFDEGDNELVDVTMLAVPMPQILLMYEELTGKKVIRDINVESVTFTLETTGKLPKRKAIEFIEKSLLLNGYAFIPAGEDMVKFINVAALKVGPERPVIYEKDKLPQFGEEVVTYVKPLTYLDPEDLKKSLVELVPLHPYGVLTPLPNSRGIVITENSNTIRYILELLEKMDQPPARTEQRSFQLTRATAADVAEALAEILDLEGKKNGSGGGSTTPTPAPQPQQPGGIPNQPGAAVASAQRTTGVYSSAPQANAVPPKIVPIVRTNKLLVIATEADLEKIGALIDELDGAAEIRNFVSRPLKYQNASDILQVLGDALQRISDEGGSGGGSNGGGSIIGGGSNSGSNRNSSSGTGGTGNFGSNSGSNSFGSGSNSFGSGSGYGSGGGSSFGGGGGVESLRQSGPPQSLVLGKTLVIADPTQNEIFASGPPEHLETINQIIDELDTRPRSVMLNVVIGSLSLGDNKDWGVDYLFRPTEVRFNGVNGMVAGRSKNRVGVAQDIADTNDFEDLADLAENITSGLQIFGTIEDQVAVAISALSTNSDFKVLSRPTLYTLNNQPASIETGLKVPVPVSTLGSYSGGTTDPTTGTSSGFVSNIQYQDVQLRLDVAPLINSDEEITLHVKQVNADIAGSTTISGNSIPNISNQGLETTVMVKNNATVLLGGLITETIDKERAGIPVLRNLPLLKYVFGSMKENKTRRELLVFIQPRIVGGDGDLPVNFMDGAGASPLGDESQRFMKQEKLDPAHDQKNIKRTKLGQLIEKLFH